jgi:hypothetical protein
MWPSCWLGKTAWRPREDPCLYRNAQNGISQKIRKVSTSIAIGTDRFVNLSIKHNLLLSSTHTTPQQRTKIETAYLQLRPIRRCDIGSFLYRSSDLAKYFCPHTCPFNRQPHNTHLQYTPIILCTHTSHWHDTWNIEPIPVIIHRLTANFFAPCPTRPNPVFKQIGNYALADLTSYLFTYAMEQSPFWEANRFTASQEIPHSMEPEGLLPHSQVSANCPYPEPAWSIPYPNILLPEDTS